MSGVTSIQWATRVWNPTTGCTRVSRGCDHCYAFALHDKRYAANLAAAAAAPHVRTRQQARDELATGEARGSSSIKLPYPRQYDVPFSQVQLLPKRLADPLAWRKRERVFVDSMADLFHEDVPADFVADVLNATQSVRLLRTGPDKGEPDPDAELHDYLILTKRPERMRRVMAEVPWIAGETFPGDAALPVALEVVGWPLPNVWLGVSVEDQAAADARIGELVRTPAAVRFLSCEPLLGPVDLSTWLECDHPSMDGLLSRRGMVLARDWVCTACGTELREVDDPAGPIHLSGGRRARYVVLRRGIDWVIAGGESGPQARPMDLAWARSLRDQCAAAGVRFFMKQLGKRPYDWVTTYAEGAEPIMESVPVQRGFDPHGGDPEEWPEDLRVREIPESRQP